MGESPVTQSPASLEIAPCVAATLPARVRYRPMTEIILFGLAALAFAAIWRQARDGSSPDESGRKKSAAGMRR